VGSGAWVQGFRFRVLSWLFKYQRQIHSIRWFLRSPTRSRFYPCKHCQQVDLQAPTSTLLLARSAGPPGKEKSEMANPEVSKPDRLQTSEIPKELSVSSAVTLSPWLRAPSESQRFVACSVLIRVWRWWWHLLAIFSNSFAIFARRALKTLCKPVLTCNCFVILLVGSLFDRDCAGYLLMWFCACFQMCTALWFYIRCKFRF